MIIKVNQLAFCLMLKIFLKFCTATQVQVVPGSTLELPCPQFPNDFSRSSISWTFNGHDVTRDSVKANKTHLTISPVSVADQGEYACSGTDPDTNVEMRITYKVIVPVLISYTVVVGEGTTARLPCNFLPGYEVKANALWSKESSSNERKAVLTSPDGTLSEDGKAALLYPLDQDQTMALIDVTMDDQALYHCDSPEGLELSKIQVIVKSAPAPQPHSCHGSTDPWETCEDDQRRVSPSVLKESLADFSFKLYSLFQASNPQTNLLYSPISISGALAHLLLGARNETRVDLENALSLPAMFPCVHLEMKRLREQLSSSLQMASQIYYNKEFNLRGSFLAQSSEFYESEPVKLQDNSEDNARTINSWVANKTRNKITQLVKSVPDDTQLLLLNAVSFSGLWTVKFSEKPMKGHFIKLNGDIVNVPILQNDKFPGSMVYVTNLKAQAMRFGLTGNNSLYILLPQTYKASDLQQVENRLTDAAVRHMIDQVRSATTQRIEVTLPQIRLNVEQDMSVLMKKLGLFSLFEGANNLCGLSEEPLILDEAKHKAHLALTEEGVEAASVTSLGFSRSLPAFSALRPFILLLWSDTAEVPLFVGRVTEP